MNVTVLRHAQSRFNVGINNERNCDLSDGGIQQAKQVTGEYDVVVVSNLRRALQTLAYSRVKYKQIIVSDLFREVIGGMACDFLEDDDPASMKTETHEDGYKRGVAARQFLKDLYTAGNPRILVITHACFICHLFQQNRMTGNCEAIQLALG